MVGKIRNGYQFFETIGESNLAKVKRAVRLSDGLVFAIKIYYHCTLKKKIKDGHKKILHEFELMSSLATTHPNILKYYEIFQDDDKLYLVLEYCDACIENLYGSENLNIKSLIRDLLNGLKFLSENNIAHHDVKPGNLFISKDTLKIGDFGVAEKFNKEVGCVSCYGTPVYQPPEVVNFEPSSADNTVDASKDESSTEERNYYDGIKADIWSAGVTIFQLFTGKLPFQQETLYLTLNQISHIKQEDVDLIASENIKNSEKSAFVKKILRVNPDERPSVDDLIKDLFEIF
jgi:serine/threonine protein kinase